MPAAVLHQTHGFFFFVHLRQRCHLKHQIRAGVGFITIQTGLPSDPLRQKHGMNAPHAGCVIISALACSIRLPETTAETPNFPKCPVNFAPTLWCTSVSSNPPVHSIGQIGLFNARRSVALDTSSGTLQIPARKHQHPQNKSHVKRKALARSS